MLAKSVSTFADVLVTDSLPSEVVHTPVFLAGAPAGGSVLWQDRDVPLLRVSREVSVKGDGRVLSLARFPTTDELWESLDRPDAPPPESVSVLPVAEQKLAGCRVLVAEDNPVNQRVISLMLDRLGAVTTVVTNGHEAVEAALSHPFDVVLMDCQMPELDGLAATGRLRAADYTKPIVALTADVTTGVRSACAAAGMDAYLSKPVSLVALEGMLLRHYRA